LRPITLSAISPLPLIALSAAVPVMTWPVST